MRNVAPHQTDKLTRRRCPHSGRTDSASKSWTYALFSLTQENLKKNEVRCYILEVGFASVQKTTASLLDSFALSSSRCLLLSQLYLMEECEALFFLLIPSERRSPTCFEWSWQKDLFLGSRRECTFPIGKNWWASKGDLMGETKTARQAKRLDPRSTVQPRWRAIAWNGRGGEGSGMREWARQRGRQAR